MNNTCATWTVTRWTFVIVTLAALLVGVSTSFAQADTTEAQAQDDGEDILMVSYPLSDERRALLEEYSQIRNIWRFVSFLVTAGILSLIIFTGLSARIRDWTQIANRRFLSMWFYVAMLVGLYYLIRLPFSWYRGYHIEQEFGFLTQSPGEWLADYWLAALILAIIAIIPVAFFYWTVKRFRRWWLVFAVGSLPIMIFFVVIAPVVINPLFNDFIPLQNEQLRGEILALADTAGIEGGDVFEVNASEQSTKINAYVTGLFNTKRIVLYDTLIKNFNIDEIRFVMAHEMGHYVMNHVWWGVLTGMILVGAALWLISLVIHRFIDRFKERLGFTSLHDYASLPLVLLFALVLNFFFQPIGNSISRIMEHQSDVYALTIIDVDTETAVRSFDKLSVYNLSDPDPHPLTEFWFYTHPSLERRMAFARDFKKDER